MQIKRRGQGSTKVGLGLGIRVGGLVAGWGGGGMVWGMGDVNQEMKVC